MTYDLIIRGGLLVRDTGVAHADMAIADEQIVEITHEIGGDARETIDAAGLHIFPGVIDPHVHFNEPGRTEWEGIASGSSALAAGGGTLYFDMPLNSSPPVLDAASFDAKLEAARENSHADFAIWAGLVPGMIDRMDELAERGVVGFKAFMSNSGIEEFPCVDDLTLLEGMHKAAKLGLPVAVHAENDVITAGLAKRAIAEARTAAKDYFASRPAVAEQEAIERAITLATDAHCALHVVHVSTGSGAAAVWLARDNGVDVTCETCPHYLLLTDHHAEKLGTIAKCAPPLRSVAEAQFLWTQLAGEEISFVASDHSPSPPEMKLGKDWFVAWGGIAGCQTTLAALIAGGYDQGRVTLQRIAALTSTAAAQRFRIGGKGKLHPGYDADVSLVDLRGGQPLREEHLFYRHRITPYIGHAYNLHGYVKRTLLRGRTIFVDGRIAGEPAGRFVRPMRQAVRG